MLDEQEHRALRELLDAAGMTYPGDPLAMAQRLLAEISTAREVADTARTAANELRREVDRILSQLPSYRQGDAFDRLRAFVNALVENDIAKVVRELRESFRSVSAGEDNDARFLLAVGALARNEHTSMNWDIRFGHLDDEELAEFSGLAQAELIARRLRPMLNDLGSLGPVET